jgi:hypothetical protein
MKILTVLLDVISTFVNLLEAEGRILRRAVMRLGWALAFMTAAFVLAVTAACLLLFSIYQYLVAQMSAGSAALLISLLALVLSLVFGGIAKWQVSDRK